MSLPVPTWIPQDGPCAYCKANAAKPAKTCADCGCPIPVYSGMGGSGYESATVAHYHLEAMGSQVGRTPIMRELCAECYVKDYAVAFPGVPSPI